MKTLQIFLFTILFTLISTKQIHAQDRLTPPSEGKAVIYFLRTQSLGSLMNFRLFDKGQIIAKYKGKNYVRYECDPGESIFWIKAENVDFIETDLEAGKIYLVETNAVMGAFSAGVKFKLVDYSDEKQMKRINKLLEEKDPKTFTEEELKKEQADNKLVIQRGMTTVVKKRKKGKKIKRITADMDYKL